MRVILPSIAEPPENVLQGAIIGDVVLGAEIDESWRGPVLQGKSMFDPLGDAVPRAMIGAFPYTPMPSSIGPMAIQGGIVGMVPIGPAVAANPIIDSTQRFLNSALPLDSTGAFFPNDILLSGYAEPAWSAVLGGETPLSAPTVLTNPLREIKDSGLLKIITSSTLPDNFGLKIYENQFSSTVFTLTGTTVDGTGIPIANCRVIAYQTGWMAVADLPVIIAETVSDGSGAFSMLLRNTAYQLTAYKEGSPDKAGITRQDVTPVVATTIYLRNPTIPDGPGGSAAYRPIGSPVVRRLQ